MAVVWALVVTRAGMALDDFGGAVSRRLEPEATPERLLPITERSPEPCVLACSTNGIPGGGAWKR